ncbi:MAG: hypothetical protein PHC83_00945 [Bacteroidales bacterium]|nr:hypothetical protein [Bacteroidales bacterium]MDD4209334.1 hypothetical protein [Bacteroidales bacterium]MDY0015636.1 hypothetical protein [Bacteroidales bacterium]
MNKSYKAILSQYTLPQFLPIEDGREELTYPSISTYTYCANKPVMFVDPKGEEWETKNDNTLFL